MSKTILNERMCRLQPIASCTWYLVHLLACDCTPDPRHCSKAFLLIEHTL